MRKWMMALVVLAVVAGSCKTVPVMGPVTPPSGQIGEATTSITAARQEVQAAGVAIKVEAKAANPAAAAPALAKIDVQADKVIAGAGKIQGQEANLVLAGQGVVALEAQVKSLTDKVAELVKGNAALTAQLSSLWRKLGIWAIGIAALVVGVGVWLGNLRLSLAAGIAGAVAVGLSILGGVIWEWRNAIVLGVVVTVAVVGIALGIEWWKKRNVANVLRETDKPIASGPTT